MLSENAGSLRRDIWDYLLKNYEKDEAGTVDYRDFLHSIQRLIKEGKLLSDQGMFRVEPNTFREIWEKPATPTFNKRSQSVLANNPMLPASLRQNASALAFSQESLHKVSAMTKSIDSFAKHRFLHNDDKHRFLCNSRRLGV